MSGPYVNPDAMTVPMGYTLGRTAAENTITEITMPAPQCPNDTDPITHEPFNGMETGTEIVVERFGPRDDQMRCYNRAAFSQQAERNGTNPVTHEPIPDDVKLMVYVDDPSGPPRAPDPLNDFRQQQARTKQAKIHVSSTLGTIRTRHNYGKDVRIPYEDASEAWDEWLRTYAPAEVIAGFPPDFEAAVKHRMYHDPGVSHD